MQKTQASLWDSFSREHYDNELKKIEDLLGIALLVSESSGKINTTGRYIRAAQVYTRLVGAFLTLCKIIPHNSLTKEENKFWDWPSVAILTRHIMEAYNVFYYVGVDSISDDEVYFRYLLMQYHHNMEKYKLYKEFGSDSSVLKEFEDGFPVEKSQLLIAAEKVPIDQRYMKNVLKGRSAMHLSHEEIEIRANVLGRFFKPFYRLFSNHAHITPFSFRPFSDERGRGEENDAERYYIVISMQVTIQYMSTAIENMTRIFPEVYSKKRFRLFLERAKKYNEDQDCIYVGYEK